MFNKTTINPTRFIDRNSLISITEKRAPTDESVRLLKEMEDAAFEKLLGNFEVKNNIISGRILFFASIDQNTNYRIKFKINGHDISFDGVIENYEFFIKNNDEIIKLFFEKVSSSLILNLLSENHGEVSGKLLKPI